MLSIVSTIVVLLSYFRSSIAAELPDVPGAKIVRGLPIGSAKLVYYLSKDVPAQNATHALIVVHGERRDAFNSFSAARAGVDAAAKEGLLRNKSVVIAAPVFFNGLRFL
jgi:hypothetical protein